MLNAALLQGYNVTWETTGFKVAWTIREIQRVKKLGYTIVVLFPLVSPSVLLERTLSRQEKTGQISAYDDLDDASTRYEKGVDNITPLLSYIDYLLVYNNQGEKGKEKLVLKMENVYNWTEEKNFPGPGWTIKADCNCSEIAQMQSQTKLGHFLQKICSDSCQQKHDQCKR